MIRKQKKCLIHGFHIPNYHYYLKITTRATRLPKGRQNAEKDVTACDLKSTQTISTTAWD